MGDGILRSHHESSLVGTEIPITPWDFPNPLSFKNQPRATHSHEGKAKKPCWRWRKAERRGLGRGEGEEAPEDASWGVVKSGKHQ